MKLQAQAAVKKTELKPESDQDSPLRFVPSETDKELSNVFYNDELIGDIGTNLTGLINEYFRLFHETEISIRKNSTNELNKTYSFEDLKGLVAKQHKLAVDIIIYQTGKKAFDAFKAVIKEPETGKRFTMAKKILKDVKSHLDLLIGQKVWITEKNIHVLGILVEKLNNMATELETFKFNSYVTKVPGLENIARLYLNKKSKDGKATANTFESAIRIYDKGPDSVVLIPSIKAAKKDAKKEDGDEKKGSKKGDKKVKKSEKSSSSSKGFW